MYTLVLPFFAWMIVLVVSTTECKSLAASLDIAVVSTYVGLLVQAVYSNGYIQINNSIKPCTAAIYGNQLNLYNLKVDLAAQRLALSTTDASKFAQRTA